MTTLVRITFTPGTSDRQLDGAWWPVSRDPTTELPALLPLLGRTGCRATGLQLQYDDWDSHPTQIRAVGRQIPILWSAQTSHLLAANDELGNRLVLFVVPADTAPLTAHRALSLPTRLQQDHSPSEVLALAASPAAWAAGVPAAR
jgi:hypothetical protein